MKKIKFIKAVLLSLTLILWSTSLFAVTTGKITGLIKDSETGEVLAGVNVLVDGTSMGGASDIDGRYFILNVPVGNWDLKATYIGYKEFIMTSVLVTIDHTTTINFDMESTVIEGEEVTVTAERKLIQMDNTATKTFISASDITTVPSESFTDLVAMEAGAVGASIRGGRSSGTIYYIDGVSMRNPMTGYGAGQGNSQTNSTNGFAASGPATDVSLNVELPEFAFEEIEMLTGGYSPEFGNAQDAVVNIATAEGRKELTGRIRVTDEGTLFTGLNETYAKDWYLDPEFSLPPDYLDGDGNLIAKGGRMVINGTELDAAGIQSLHRNSELGYVKGEEAYVNSEPIWTDTRGDYQRRKYSFNLTGPLFSKAYFALSGEYLDQERAHFDNQSRDNFSILGKVTYNLSAKTKFNLSLLRANQLYKIYDYEYAKYNTSGYLPGFGTLYAGLSVLPDRIKETSIFTGVLNHSINANSYLTLTVGTYNSTYDQKYHDYDDRDADGDRDEYLVFKRMEVKSGHPDSTSGAYAFSSTRELRYTTNDNGLIYIWTQDPTKIDSANYPNTYLPGYLGEWRIGNPDLLVDRNDPGTHLWTDDNPVGWKEIWTPQYNVNTDNWEWTSDWLFVNGANEFEETGVTHPELDEGTMYNVSDALWKTHGEGYATSSMESKVTTVKLDYSNQIHPIHFIQLGGEYLLYNLDAFIIRTFSLSNYYLDEWHQKPTEWGLYFRDKIEMGGLIVNAGLRLDSYNLGDCTYSGDALDPTSTPVDPETEEILNPVTWSEEVGPTIYFSPRLGISHPITDRDVLHFSYNHFLQRPDWRYFFENIGYSTQGAYEQIGNPELEPQRTISYEVGFTHQFSNDLKVDITAYYKDIFGWVQQTQINQLAGTRFWIYENADFGAVKGFEVALDKRMSNNFSADVNYTYMISSGRLSDPQLGNTYLWRNLIAPKDPHPLDHDQRHTLSLKLAYYVPPARNQFAGDWLINLTNRYGSGFPYDTQSRSVALTVPAENDGRLPFNNRLDLRIQKRFTFKPVKLAAYVEVFNVLNRQDMGFSPAGIPYNAEWYQSREDNDGNGVADHYLDPEGRYGDWTVWTTPRRAKVGIELNW
ncbi:MAG: TonB-dependent receptor [Candidatus Neomarinimicrobiota bacterium]